METEISLSDINKKFNKEEENLKERLKNTVSVLETAHKLETKFLDEVEPVNSIYSPIKDLKEITVFSKEILKYIDETKKVLKLEKSKLENMQKKLNDIKVKVALFGDVSAGKSQTINSILGRKLFIPAYCHTTICFVKINLSDNDNDEVTSPNGTLKVCNDEEEIRSIVKDFANFNGNNKLKPDEFLKISVKKQDNSTILGKNVTLIDCPGGNDTQEVTDMIENVVVEADIFLYILTQVIFEQQRLFFNKLLTKTSAPNVFVLVNKWDETDNDEASDTAKAQVSLKSEISKWLTDIDPDNKEICDDRIFFISAKETLQRKTGASSTSLTEPQKMRLNDFTRFEKIFKEHLDNPKEIKINKHIKEFDKMNKNLDGINERNIARLEELRNKKEACRKQNEQKINHLENTRNQLCKETEEKIENMTPDKYDDFFKSQLKYIGKQLECFSDISHVPETSSLLDKAASWISWGRKKVGLEDQKFKVKKELMDSVVEHIDNEIKIIREPLQKELDVYVQYLAALPVIN